jgi:hypothetical protein
VSRPRSATAPQTIIVPSRPMGDDERGTKIAEPNVAPALPIAAQKPLSVERRWRGNVSAGRMNVVEFGPKLEKKKVKP